MSLGRITPIASRLHMIGCVTFSWIQFTSFMYATVAVVCDGASSNMTMVKEMSGSKRGAYGCVNENLLICLCTIFFSFLDGSESIQPSFLSPYTGKLVHFIICPSHQVCIIIVWSPPNTRTRTSTVEKYGIRTVSVKITGKRRNERFSDWGSKLRLVCA